MTTHVLLIDDDPEFTESIRVNFMLNGMEIETTSE